MKTYSIKVALRGISPMIWRRFRINGITTIADLHHIIQLSMGWDDYHLHRFRIHGKDYGIGYVGGCSFRDDAAAVFIDHFDFDVGDKFVYEYNFHEARICDIRIEKIEDDKLCLNQPRCIGGKGIYHEYPVRYEFDVLLDMSILVQKLLTKVTKHRLAKASVLSEEYNALKYSRKRINQQLFDFHTDPSYR